MQLEGFKAAAHLLQRTPAACGFRWNNEVRKNNVEQLEGAKERKVEIHGTKPNRARKERNHLVDVGTDEVIAQAAELIEHLVAENQDLKKQIAQRDNQISILTAVLKKARESISFSDVTVKPKRRGKISN